MKIKYFFPFILLPLFCMCNGCENIVDHNDKSEGVYLEGFEVTPLQSQISGVQPMTGIVLWPAQAKSRNSTYGNSISLEFSYCLPSDVVTGKTDGSGSQTFL